MIQFVLGAGQSRNHAIFLGVASFLGVATISNIVTTEFSYSAVAAVRVFFAACVALSVFAIASSKGVNSTQLIAASLFLLLTAYAVFLSVLNSVAEIGLASLAVDVAIILSGIFLIFSTGGSTFPRYLAEVFVFYAFVVIAFTILIGGVYFDPVLRFNFEYGSTLIGREEDYSLGMSYFYGLSSIAAAIVSAESQQKLRSVLFQLFCMTFLVLSFLGGGRGEIAIAVLVLSLIIFAKNPILFLKGLLVVSLLLLWLGPILADLLGQFAVVERFKMLFDGDLSSRDALLLDAMNLIIDNTRCLVFGCGIGFFQSYYGYDAGLYPHNSFVEAVIIFGLPVTLIVLFVFLRGMVLYYQKAGIDLFLAFSIYAALVSLKSQYLYGGWILMVSVSYFFWVGLGGAARRGYSERFGAVV